MELETLLASQHGLVLLRQLKAVGTTTAGLVDISQGVYGRPGSDRKAHLTAVRAEILRKGDGWVAARRSAALLYDLPLIGRLPRVPQLHRASGSGAKGRDRHARIGTLRPQDVVEFKGLPVQSPARAVIDLARTESFESAVVVLDAVLRRGVERAELEDVLGSMRRWPGIDSARRAVAFADGRAESVAESLARVTFHLEKLPVPEPQVQIFWRDQLVARTDLLDRKTLLATEVDGAVKFTDAGVLPALLVRHEQIRDCGIDVLRTNYREVTEQRPVLAGRVRDRNAMPRALAPEVTLVSSRVRPVKPYLFGLPMATPPYRLRCDFPEDSPAETSPNPAA